MIKKIITRIIKVINILINGLIGLVAFGNVCQYGTNGYLYSDTWQRMIWIITMTLVINIVDSIIIKKIEKF